MKADVIIVFALVALIGGLGFCPTRVEACSPAAASVMQGSYTSIVLQSSQKWRWNCAGQSRSPGTQILMWWDNVPAEWEQFYIFRDESGRYYINSVMATCVWYDCLMAIFGHNPVVVQGNGLQLGDYKNSEYGSPLTISCDACSDLQAGHYAQGCIIRAGDQCVNKAWSAALVLGSCSDADKWDFWA